MQNERATNETKQRGHADGEEMPEDRVLRHVNGEDASGVGAETIKGRVTERDDARVAEGQIERQGEQRPDHHLRAKAEIIVDEEIERGDHKPRQGVANEGKPARTGHVAERRGGGGGGRAHQTADLAGSRPCGRHNRSAKTAA